MAKGYGRRPHIGRRETLIRPHSVKRGEDHARVRTDGVGGLVGLQVGGSGTQCELGHHYRADRTDPMTLRQFESEPTTVRFLTTRAPLPSTGPLPDGSAVGDDLPNVCARTLACHNPCVLCPQRAIRREP
jgi:hypothetical protein